MAATRENTARKADQSSSTNKDRTRVNNAIAGNPTREELRERGRRGGIQSGRVRRGEK